MKWNKLILEETNKISFYKHPRGKSSVYKNLTAAQTDKLVKI